MYIRARLHNNNNKYYIYVYTFAGLLGATSKIEEVPIFIILCRLNTNRRPREFSEGIPYFIFVFYSFQKFIALLFIFWKLCNRRYRFLSSVRPWAFHVMDVVLGFIRETFPFKTWRCVLNLTRSTIKNTQLTIRKIK